MQASSGNGSSGLIRVIDRFASPLSLSSSHSVRPFCLGSRTELYVYTCIHDRPPKYRHAWPEDPSHKALEFPIRHIGSESKYRGREEKEKVDEEGTLE